MGSIWYPARFLKTASPVRSSQLADIFNQCIEQRTFPDDLKIKKSPRSSSLGKDYPGNYRQIFLKSYCTNSCINFWQTIKCWVISNGDSETLRSTIHALQKSVNNRLLNVDKEKTNALIFLDVKKAFDTVDGNTLLKKLSSYGFQDKELSLMHSNSPFTKLIDKFLFTAP